MPALSEEEKAAFHAIRRRLSRCPAWCFCNTKKVKKVKYVPCASTEARENQHVKFMEVRRFSLNPMCPLISFLCPPNGLPDRAIKQTASLYMTTIEGTRFNDVVFECEVIE